MSKKRIKQYLMLLTVVGLVAVAAGGGSGTFASFSAETTNPGNTFATGTLYLDNTANGGTACESEAGALNVNASCDVLFPAIDISTGDAVAHLALKNDGTINASDVKWDVPSCGVAANTIATGSNTTFGTLTCGDLWMSIQETGASYLPAGNVACAAGTTTTPPDCDSPDGSVTLAAPGTPTDLLTTSAVSATFDAGTTRYYVITVHPNVANDNILQNRLVTFAMHWKLEQ